MINLLSMFLTSTVPSATATAPTTQYTGPAGSDVMAVICLVLLVAGSIYLAIGHFRSKK